MSNTSIINIQDLLSEASLKNILLKRETPKVIALIPFLIKYYHLLTAFVRKFSFTELHTAINKTIRGHFLN